MHRHSARTALKATISRSVGGLGAVAEEPFGSGTKWAEPQWAPAGAHLGAVEPDGEVPQEHVQAGLELPGVVPDGQA